MLRTLVFFFLMLPVFGLHAQPLQVPTRILKDYFIYDQSQVKQSKNFFVITKRKDMDKLFGAVTRPDTPDFSKEWMLVMALPESSRESKLSFSNISMRAGDAVGVYYSMKKNQYPLTYKTNAVVVAVIPRNKAIRFIHFCDESTEHISKTIELKD